MHINEFQEMMRRLYFERDAKRGAIGTFNWLVDEVGELEKALKSGNKHAVEEESADVIAWLASLANVVGIALEKAAVEKYDSRCPKCCSLPCHCSF